MKSGIYVYAILDKKPDLDNYLKKTGLKSLNKGDLMLVYKEINAKKLKTEIDNASKNLISIKKLLETHEKVINGLGNFGTLIPFRFGTVLKNVTAGQKLLEEKHHLFEELLKKIKGKEEWGVRIYKDNKTFKKYFEKGKAQNTKMSGTSYLLKIKEEKDFEEKSFEMLEKIASDILNEAKEFSSQINKGNLNRQASEKTELLLSNSFLINSKDRDNFKNKMNSLKKKYEAMGVNLELSGPWQPYSFV